MRERAELMSALAYRLYALCERKGCAKDAGVYNELVTACQSIKQACAEAGMLGSQAHLEI